MFSSTSVFMLVLQCEQIVLNMAKKYFRLLVSHVVTDHERNVQMEKGSGERYQIFWECLILFSSAQTRC